MPAFRKKVWDHYKKHGRHDLPWRKTTDPYKILVSEVMLQQTQVPRVIEKYKSFLKKFPTVKKLAAAPLAEVLKEWSGLGYNLRGKYLHDAAKVIVGKHRCNFKEALEHPLPGVGSYTKAAVKVFAFDVPEVLIETNVRAAFIHHFYTNKLKNVGVSDRELLPLIERAAKEQNPREWYWALMDYGVHIKKLHGNPGRRSAHYAKQSKFEGSLRQVRGEILRQLGKNSLSERNLFVIANEVKQSRELKRNPGSRRFARDDSQFQKALIGLQKDGLIKKEKGKWRLPDR